MTKKRTAITFLIPTYGGLALLEKNLPSILREMQTGDELLISEDKVTDLENLRYFRKKYNVQLTPIKNKNGQLYRARVTHRGKSITISFFQRRRNGRFARNVNEAVALIEHNYFFLLNNDVKLTPGCRDKLLSVLQADPKAFAVTAQEIDVKDGNRPSGRNKIWWARGRFWHDRDTRLDESGATAWACGGSSLYDIDKWQILGGFDTRYYPAYWEDIDISWAAHQRGWKVLYCHQAVVQHVHETTNQDVFGEKRITQMSWDNGTKFTWKNARGRQKWEFLLYYWYWQLKQFPALRLWVGVLLVALAMRLAYLGIPHGLTVDEAAIAYNGAAIWQQRRDEWLNFLPVTFRSFGDYKAPLAIYVSALVTGFLGLEIWTVRLPFALAGVASIWLVMKLIDFWLRRRTPHHLTLAAIGGLLLVVSPWHFHFSHLGFENNWSLLWQLAGLYGLSLFLATPTDRRGRPWEERIWAPPLVGATVSLVLSLYSYHAAKLTVPLILLAVIVMSWRTLWQRRRALITPCLLGLVLVSPLLQDSFCEVAPERPFTFLAWSQSVEGRPVWRGGICGDGKLTGRGLGLSRGGSSFLSDPELSFGEKIVMIGENYRVYLHPDFLWGGQLDLSRSYDDQIVPNVRHGIGFSGVLLAVQLVMSMILLATLICRPAWARSWWREVVMGLVMIVVGLLPATITTNVPHPNQALGAIVGFTWLSVLGFIAWRTWWREHAIYYPSLVMLVLVFAGIEFGVAQKHYLEIMKPVHSVEAGSHAQTAAGKPTRTEGRQKDVSFLYNVNLLDALQLAREHKKEVAQIIVAVPLEQPYIQALVAEQLTPEQYRYGKLSEKYMFVSGVSMAELTKSNVIVIYSPLVTDETLNRLALERCDWVENFYFGRYNNLRVCRTRTLEVITDPLEPADEESEL